MKTMPKFETWMAAVNAATESLVGLATNDLADAPYMDWYEDGKSPTAAAKAAVRLNGFDG
jgi:hypothetical protein